MYERMKYPSYRDYLARRKRNRGLGCVTSGVIQYTRLVACQWAKQLEP